MKYNVFVSITTGVEVEALNEEDAKKKVYDNLVVTNQIKPADVDYIIKEKNICL